ncbi:MAG: winged helix-turn-helix transcriptional regulator [Thermoplasmatota archaeon]
MRLPGSRRLVRALLIASLTAVLLGAAVGASNGTEQQARPAVHVPVPQLGDRGAYVAELDGSYEPNPEGGRAAFPFLAFEWAPGAPERGADGLLHATDRVQTSGWTYQGWAVALNRLREDNEYLKGIPESPVWVRHNETLVFDQGTADLLATEDDVHGVDYDNTTVPRSALGGGVGPLTRDGTLAQRTITTNGTQSVFEPGAAADCLFLNGFQNRTIALGDTVSFQRSCDLHGLLLAVGVWEAEAAAVEEVHGLPALRMDPVVRGSGSGLLDGDSGYHFGGGAITVWLANGIPYPVRIAWTTPEERYSSVVELAGYQPGTQPRLAPTPPHDPAPDLVLAPPTPWGLDETGVHHPFPLSAAYRGARDDPNFSSLRSYLQSHPDAFLGSAVYDIGATSQAGTQRTWRFTVTDGDSWLAVTAKRSDSPQGPLGVPLPLPGGLPGATAANTTYSAGSVEHGSQYWAGLFPTPSEAPDLLPTVASMMARWEAYASPDYRERGADAWGFQITCFRVLGKECRSVWVSTWAGHADASAGQSEVDQSSTPPTLRASGDAHASLLHVFDNRTQALTEAYLTEDQRTGVAPAPALTPSSVPASSGVRPAATLTAWVPTPEQAAGVGAAAVAVGLLYYLWPLAKGGLGLFSRLKQPEVLAHPARQQLLQLIEAQPGIHFKEMARRTGLPNGSLVHHLETLRRGGQVVARPAGGYTLYFLGAHVPAGSAEAASALKADGARRILELVRQQPGLSSADVAARCGLQPSTVTYHVQRLQAAGLLTGLRDGRAVRLHPVDAAATAA